MTDAAAVLTLRPSERFEIGGVISRTFSIVGRNLPVFAPLAAVCVVVPSVFQGALSLKLNGEQQTANVLADLANHGSQATDLGLMLLVWVLLAVIGYLYLQAAVSAVVIGQEQRTAAPNLLSAPWRHLLPLLGIVLLSIIAFFIGTILLIVPGIIVGMALSVVGPARVGEGLGVFASLQRSWALTQGFRWRIFLVFFLLTLIFLGAEIVVVLLRLLFHISMAMWTAGVVPILTGALDLVYVAAAAVIYCDLRKVKEGASATGVAASYS
jgi:hypothetical protein